MNGVEIDLFFLHKLKKIVEFEQQVSEDAFNKDTLEKAKKLGFSDKTIAELAGVTETDNL